VTVPATNLDVIASLAGIDGDSPLAELRAQRPESAKHAQGSYDALFDPVEPNGLTAEERLAVAVRVAALHGADAASGHYHARVAEMPEREASPRLAALLRHADLLATRPVAARVDDLQALADAGLSTPEIVTLSQVIAFVSFQVRVIAGLRLLGATAAPQAGAAWASRPVAASPSDRPRAKVLRPAANLRRPTAFTIEQLEWTPWLEPLELANANAKQAAALEGTRGNSPYFRLLAYDVDVLTERTATDRGIFYTPGGAPRPDRELSAAATSRLNGCIYCTSVHARLASQLSKRTEDIDRLLALGVTPGTQLDLGDRWQAIVDLAVALAPTPPTVGPQQVARLREVGLSDLEILDVIQAGAFFAWANRLMLTLGEPYYPDATAG
jgi:alkylhydroperoxidase domain protein